MRPFDTVPVCAACAKKLTGVLPELPPGRAGVFCAHLATYTVLNLQGGQIVGWMSACPADAPDVAGGLHGETPLVLN